MRKTKILLAALLATVCTTVYAADTKMAEHPAAMSTKPVFMSAEWAKQACAASQAGSKITASSATRSCRFIARIVIPVRE